MCETNSHIKRGPWKVQSEVAKRAAFTVAGLWEHAGISPVNVLQIVADYECALAMELGREKP